MAPFFTSERFGTPQIYAGVLLLVFMAQCAWLMSRVPFGPLEQAFVESGHGQWRGQGLAGDVVRSPLIPLIAGLPALVSTSPWWLRLPFLVMGVLLGASLWYVARRLYGNAGGYIALILYAFSPPIIVRSATVHPEIAAAWGTFGAIFTAIAVSHTLYAPREVVLWNWRRILLLGLALTFAIGAQFSLVIIIPLALAFMFYLVPHRIGAAAVILAAACAIACVLIWASYFSFFHLSVERLALARVLEFQPQLFRLPVTWNLLGLFFLRIPGVMLLLAIALITYVAWRRTRFFGTAAPLITAAVLIVLAMAMPHLGGYTFLIVMLPFAYVFIAGVFADLLETRASGLVLGLLAGVLLSHAMFNILGLARLHR